MLIHLVGDMHCPMHLGRLSDLGGNRRPVRFFNRETSLHSVWDTNLPEAVHNWSYTEWKEPDRPAERRRGRRDHGRRARRLGEGDARHLQRNLRLEPRRYENRVRLHFQIHARYREAVLARRSPPGTPAERDLPIGESRHGTARGSQGLRAVSFSAAPSAGRTPNPVRKRLLRRFAFLFTIC